MAKTLEDYKAEQRRLETQIANRRYQNRIIAGQVSRLEEAYNKLGEIKDKKAMNADQVRDKTKVDRIAYNVEWRGKHKDQFDSAVEDKAKEAAEDFYKSIDEIQDEIGRALDRKRGEYNTGIGLLNGLNRAWNSVTGTIRNWFN